MRFIYPYFYSTWLIYCILRWKNSWHALTGLHRRVLTPNKSQAINNPCADLIYVKNTGTKHNKRNHWLESQLRYVAYLTPRVPRDVDGHHKLLHSLPSPRTSIETMPNFAVTIIPADGQEPPGDNVISADRCFWYLRPTQIVSRSGLWTHKAFVKCSQQPSDDSICITHPSDPICYSWSIYCFIL